MTSQALMPNSPSRLKSIYAPDCGTGSASNGDTFVQSICTQKDTGRTVKLPYRENHQAEWLHLQADIDALLQQLQQLQQQRSPLHQSAQENSNHTDRLSQPVAAMRG
jgi:hypothetical protein